jgi:hypothetical protein
MAETVQCRLAIEHGTHLVGYRVLNSCCPERRCCNPICHEPHAFKEIVEIWCAGRD